MIRTWEDLINPTDHNEVLAERDRAYAEQRAMIEAIRGTIPAEGRTGWRQPKVLVTVATPRNDQWTFTRIGLLRTKLGWSQDRFAREIGAGQRTVSEWEQGKYRPKRVVHLERLHALEQQVKERDER